MKVITYRITLLEPTLVTAAEGDPNSGVAYEFLPGSVLRGSLIASYLRRQNVRELDMNDPVVRTLFFDGTTRYLNGYLIDRQANRSLPTPHSWLRKKGEETPIYDFGVEEPDGEEQWQGVRYPFCALKDGSVELFQPERHISVHTARTRRFGRAMARDKIGADEIPGEVFRYDALAAGQTFEAAFLCGSYACAATLAALLTGEKHLGGSRTAGYGLAAFHDVREVGANWREVGYLPVLQADDRLIITLLSDALIRDQDGQFAVDPEIVRSELSARLRCPLTLERAFLRGRAVGGFNRKWGLPLPQALAVEMGSVFVFRAPAFSQSQLRDLEDQGIGERRSEGFGRLAVNWHVQEPVLRIDPKPIEPPSPSRAIAAGTEGEALAKQMVERMLRRRLDSAITIRANTLGRMIQQPSPSQLSRVQAVILDALEQSPGEGRMRLTSYFAGIQDRQTASRQFTRDRVSGRTLLEWLRFRVSDASDIWSEFQIQEANLPKVGTVRGALTDQLAYEYNLRLIHEVLALAAKDKRKGGE